MIPGIMKDNPLIDPTKTYKELISAIKELTNVSKEFVLVFKNFLQDIKPWTKAFLGTAAWMMFWSGMAIAKVFFGG